MKNYIILILSISLGFNPSFAQQDLLSSFDACQVEGSITLYDYNAKKWIYSDSLDSHYPTLPASTFKIVNTLIAIDAEIILSENEIIRWPGVTDTIKYGYRPDIYQDMSMKDAFKTSAGWAYVEMAKEIGKEKYQGYLTAINYGNADLSIDDVDFWNFGDFAISPANQIEILVGVYEETLPFSNESFGILKKIMIEEETPLYTLRAKTGWTSNKGKDIGWWVGYLEQNNNVYFFATRLIKDRASDNPDFAKCRKSITKGILNQFGLLN